MAKRQSTLFNFFTPQNGSNQKTEKKGADNGVIDNTAGEQSAKKRPRLETDNDDDLPNERRSSKIVRKCSSGSESENSPPKETKRKRIMRVFDSSDSEMETENDSKKILNKFSFKKEVDSGSDTINIKQEISSTPKTTALSKNLPVDVKDIHSNWMHNTLDFLKPHKIMDINRRKPSDPDYDDRTLYVPEKFLSGLSPAMRQWWQLKSQHMDAVLFFKVGKFYELYHMDAVVGVTQLGFSYMKGDFAHSGFPETAYGKMAAALIDKGYKVARVEQTETPEMMADRVKATKGSTKFDKVVKREICQVSTKATCIYTAQMQDCQSEVAYYLYSLCVKEGSQGVSRIGVCFVETSIGTFFLSEFDDDKHFSRLLALFAEYPPTMVLTEKGGLSKQLNELLNCNFKDIKTESLISKSQFYTAPDTLEKLSTACYFKDSKGVFYWPEIFKKIADDCMPKNEYQLTIRSLGACIWYLKMSKIDIHILSLGKFEWYNPLDFKQKGQQDYLLLDAVTIHNLDLLETKISLKQTLDHCETAFGKRLLMRWICRPLCNIRKITERQKAIKYLWDRNSLLTSAQAILKKLPDLERQLTKIHTFGNIFIATDHPDGRAIFYEAKTYSKRKIKDFLRILKAFEKVHEIPDLFKDCDDRLLRKITQLDPVGVNIDLSNILSYFKNAFDQEEAEKEGKIIPKRGVVEEFDNIETKIDNINTELNNYLEKQCRFFGCKVSYVGTERKRFQLEVPENKSSKATDEYHLEGARKGSKPVKKYSTPITRQLLANMIEAETERAKIVHDLNRQIFEKFSTNRDNFDRVIQCLTILDVLCSLAQYATSHSSEICLPRVLPFCEQPKVELTVARHPCIRNVDNFVPNDIKIGVDGQASILILTGPNMGGKSTLMRQVAVIAVMAQLGSFVPAATCELSLIDRIFTRLGAQDDILQGQSTFYVELSEASSILRHATKHSLVVIDELGRGTSTHDGNAIATAYVKKLTEIQCRTTFSTHYHSLVDNFRDNSNVQLTHMACMVEKDDDTSEESVTFLYKLAEGTCPRSYGFNVAKLAGLDRSIITNGRQIAKHLEKETQFRNVFSCMFNKTKVFDVSVIREMLLSITD